MMFIYYVFDVMIDIQSFHSNLLKIDKKSHKDIDMLVTSQLRS